MHIGDLSFFDQMSMPDSHRVSQKARFQVDLQSKWGFFQPLTREVAVKVMVSVMSDYWDGEDPAYVPIPNSVQGSALVLYRIPVLCTGPWHPVHVTAPRPLPRHVQTCSTWDKIKCKSPNLSSIAYLVWDSTHYSPFTYVAIIICISGEPWWQNGVSTRGRGEISSTQITWLSG